MLQVLGSFGDLSAPSAGPERVDAAPPELPAPEECPRDAATTELAKAFMHQVDLRLHPEDVGFRSEDVLTTPLPLSRAAYGTPDHHARFHERLIRELEARPGVASAGVMSSLPVAGSIPNGLFELDGAGASFERWRAYRDRVVAPQRPETDP